jgi:hypothetical protein
MKGKFSNHYNMSSIIDKYQQIIEGTIKAKPTWADGLEWLLDEQYLEGVMRTLSEKEMWEYFNDCEWWNPESPEELIATGLLLGYPIESTGSLVIDSLVY